MSFHFKCVLIGETFAAHLCGNIETLSAPCGTHTVTIHQIRLKLCTHYQHLRIRKFCIYANFAYVSKSIFCFAFTWLLRTNRICRKLKFYSIKVIVILELRTCLNILDWILQVSKLLLGESTYVTMHML